MSLRDYFAPDWHGPPFALFGPGHLLSLALIAALAYTFLPIETHGKALSLKGEPKLNTP